MVYGNVIKCVDADLPLLRVEITIGEPVNKFQVQGDLVTRHFVKGRDIDEQVYSIFFKHLSLMWQKEDNVGCVYLGIDFPDFAERPKTEGFSFREDPGQVILCDVKGGGYVHDDVPASRESSQEDVCGPSVPGA